MGYNISCTAFIFIGVYCSFCLQTLLLAFTIFFAENFQTQRNKKLCLTKTNMQIDEVYFFEIVESNEPLPICYGQFGQINLSKSLVRETNLDWQLDMLLSPDCCITVVWQIISHWQQCFDTENWPFKRLQNMQLTCKHVQSIT